jgi:tRNA pseudouridine38-40 synthase
MFNYLIKIEYEGTNFVGWQSQKNGKSIQDNVEKALRKVLGIKIRITGAGRTDKGVHAYSQTANFKLKKKISNKNVFLNSVNFFLKKKLISILDLKKQKDNFHARFSAKLRTYEYLIMNRQGTLSILKNRAWHVKKKINLDLMKKGAKLLEGTHDFSTFRAASCTAQSPLRKIYPITIKKVNEVIKIRISSKSFLQNQVRSMVGCLYYLSTYKWSFNDFKKAFKSKKRIDCAPPAPACGLYLFKIKY